MHIVHKLVIMAGSCEKYFPNPLTLFRKSLFGLSRYLQDNFMHLPEICLAVSVAVIQRLLCSAVAKWEFEIMSGFHNDIDAVTI